MNVESCLNIMNEMLQHKNTLTLLFEQENPSAMQKIIHDSKKHSVTRISLSMVRAPNVHMQKFKYRSGFNGARSKSNSSLPSCWANRANDMVLCSFDI